MTSLHHDATRLVDDVAAAVLAVPGVAALHGGEFGEVATYLPGRRVTGIVLGDDACRVHVTVHYPVDAVATADAVRDAVARLVGAVPIEITIGDVETPHDTVDVEAPHDTADVEAPHDTADVETPDEKE
ncbi:hypothetical protein [Rhodococcus sp. HNM0569]|uniref:hypothetical protein n=1 Tax=Rhodococcus sp. HNM0569 TaxID=2716340 RepID=UPI001F10C59C|nr:hypothetical protein [Rhodococcus sp. HNM0569]